MKRYVMIVVSPARPTPTARAAAACPSSCVDPARESSRRACSVPRTPTARHRTCQPPLGGGVTSSAAIDAGRGGVRRPGRLHRLRQHWLLQLAGRARCRDGRAPVGFLTDPERESRRPRFHRISQPVHHTRRHDAQGPGRGREQERRLLHRRSRHRRSRLAASGGVGRDLRRGKPVDGGRVREGLRRYLHRAAVHLRPRRRTAPSRGSVRQRNAMCSASGPLELRAVCSSWGRCPSHDAGRRRLGTSADRSARLPQPTSPPRCPEASPAGPPVAPGMYAVTITPVDGRNAHVANPSRQGLGRPPTFVPPRGAGEGMTL